MNICLCDDDTSGCVFNTYWPEVEEETLYWIQTFTEDNKPNNQYIRNRIYSIFSRIINGYMGTGNRARLPICITTNVRNKFPAEDGTYIGFKGTNDKLN